MKVHGSAHRTTATPLATSRAPKSVEVVVDEIGALYARAYSPISAYTRAARDVETIGATTGHTWAEVPMWDRPRVRRALVRLARATSSTPEADRLISAITDLPFSVRVGDTAATTTVFLSGTEVR